MEFVFVYVVLSVDLRGSNTCSDKQDFNFINNCKQSFFQGNGETETMKQKALSDHNSFRLLTP